MNNSITDNGTPNSHIITIRVMARPLPSSQSICLPPLARDMTCKSLRCRGVRMMFSTFHAIALRKQFQREFMALRHESVLGKAMPGRRSVTITKATCKPYA
ncbi:MAG TPA: hypothetical protein VHB46_11565 [Burkholderiales bacterium]|nr:hypothetical protein [Burkholderiales bacterium]